MTKQLKLIQKAGYIHNDIKLENVLVRQTQENVVDYDSAILIDFGLSSRYLDESGEHIKFQKVNTFRGNLVFSSKNAFNMDPLSRRDDFISLAYLLLYLSEGVSTFLKFDPTSASQTACFE